jgi:hypothetical protein
VSVRSPYDDVGTCPCPLCRHHVALILDEARALLVRGIREYRQAGIADRAQLVEVFSALVDSEYV